MKTLKFNIEIHSTPEKIWHILWDEENYKKWTETFCVGSYYKSSLIENDTIDFLSPEGDGLHSKISKHIPNQYLEATHLTEIRNFEIQPITPEIEEWTGCIESYRLNQKDNFIELIASVDCLEKYITYFEEKFPLAMAKVKELAEQ